MNGEMVKVWGILDWGLGILGLMSRSRSAGASAACCSIIFY
jgi:hypothetical protein